MYNINGRFSVDNVEYKYVYKFSSKEDLVIVKRHGKTFLVNVRLRSRETVDINEMKITIGVAFFLFLLRV